ncbi:MAG: nucleotidyltransferase domain-containing protein [Acidilobaceae archaeon]
MEKIISERLRERERALSEAVEFAKCVKGKLGRVTVILYGSYARGDFNEWSDIDVLVIAEQLPENPVERLSLIEDCMARVAGVEPLLLTPDMMRKMRGKNLAVREALERGVVLVDDLLRAIKIP